MNIFISMYISVFLHFKSSFLLQDDLSCNLSFAKINISADFVVVFRNDQRKISAVDFRLLSHKTTETETKLCESFTHGLCKSTSSVTYVAQDNSTVSIVIKLILRNRCFS